MNNSLDNNINNKTEKKIDVQNLNNSSVSDIYVNIKEGIVKILH